MYRPNNSTIPRVHKKKLCNCSSYSFSGGVGLGLIKKLSKSIINIKYDMYMLSVMLFSTTFLQIMCT